MFLVKHLVKRSLLAKPLPKMWRAMCNNPITKEDKCSCSCCDDICEFEPAAIKTPAPDFKARAWHDGFKDINLSEYKGKYVVLFFYPLDFTFVCPTEIIEFSKKSPLFRETSI